MEVVHHEYLDSHALAVALEIVGIAVAVVGVYLIAASPIVSGHLSHPRHRDHPRHRRGTGTAGDDALQAASRLA